MKVKNSTMQAFPFIEPQENENIKAYHPGMTMRDEFAKAAMQSILPAYQDVFDDETQAEGEPSFPELIAKDAYIMADAMLKARK
jgi:hypothetical protein